MPDFYTAMSQPQKDQEVLGLFAPQQQAMLQPQQQQPITSQSIQEALGARQPTQGGTVMDILAQRFQPTQDDNYHALLSTLMGKPQTAETFANERGNAYAQQLGSLAQIQKLASGGGGGATGEIVSRIIAERKARGIPDDQNTFEGALHEYQTGWRNGMQLDESGNLMPIPGYNSNKQATKYAEKSGMQGAELQYAAPIAQATAEGAVAGKGEITPIDQRNRGLNQVSTMIGTIGNYYDQLDKAGGAVNPSNTAGQNVGAYLGNTNAGQLRGKVAGTATQSIRNNIEQSRPLLINAIRQATGMSAKAMDSNAELQFYLKAATDPTLDVTANKKALKMLDSLYGLGSTNTEEPTAPPSGAVDWQEYFK